jgi:hypothetical protein
MEDRSLTTRGASRTAGGAVSLLACVALTGWAGGCRTAPTRPPAVAVPSPAPPDAAEVPSPSPAEELTVKRAVAEVVVAAWAEPSNLPAGGGQAQILVRAQKRGGAPFPGVEVRLHTSVGTLYSGDRVLVTDSRGMTRDRLTAHRTAEITLNAGGTRYRFTVPVLLDSAQ